MAMASTVYNNPLFASCQKRRLRQQASLQSKQQKEPVNEQTVNKSADRIERNPAFTSSRQRYSRMRTQRNRALQSKV